MNQTNVELVNTIRFAMKTAKEYRWSDPFRHTEALDKLGEEIGHEVAHTFIARDARDLAAKFSSFWSSGGLGNMSVIQTEPLLIEVRACYDCAGWRMGAPAGSCTFKKRLFKTVFQDVLNTHVRVDEVECCKKMAPACLFKLSVD